MATTRSRNSESSSSKGNTKGNISNLKGDYVNIAFLLLLYVLQGIPIGLSAAVPLLLQNRKVSYSDQATFSFVTWPFSVKLLWAPIVDSVFIKRIGRRKSWLIPTQFCIGIFMMVLSSHVDALLTSDPITGEKPSIKLLTFIFLMLNFLAATQDIAVDGWALTMLSRKNVGYASTCNTAGQTAGYFIGNVVFLALESQDFCNKYVRSAANQSPVGIVTFEGFLYYCGIVFIVVTAIVTVLKGENKGSPTKLSVYEDGEQAESQYVQEPMLLKPRRAIRSSSKESVTSRSPSRELELGIRETYSVLYKIIKLPSFKLFAAILLTCKVGFSAPDAVSGLKLVEAGVRRENLALLAVPMVPLQVILPWLISRLTCGPRPLDLFIKAYPFRLLFGIIFPFVVHWTSSVKQDDGTFPLYYYLLLIIIYALHQITVYSMFVALMAFNAAVSDPLIGGTYMTLLNTIANLGGNWPSTLSLWLVDKLTILYCQPVCKNAIDIAANSAQAPNTPTSKPELICEDSCVTTVDGYYIECVVCIIVGFIWLQWGSKKLKKLQSLPLADWKCR